MSKNAVSNIAGGGEPPYDVEMDRRLTVLETRFDTMLPTLATKSDVADLRQEVRVGFEALRAEMHKTLHDTLRWIMGMVISLFLGALAANVTILNVFSNRIASQRPAPVVERSAAPTKLPSPLPDAYPSLP